MKTYITELLSHPEGGRRAGPHILAMTWEEAEQKAAMCNAKVTGELCGIIKADGSAEWWAKGHGPETWTDEERRKAGYE